MRQATNFDLVREFHEKFGVAGDEEMTSENLLLRANLIDEEFSEVMNEFWNDCIPTDKTWTEYRINPDAVDKVKLTKELCDLLYVVYGTGVTFGLPLDVAFREVHRSNMSKLGPDGKPIYRDDGKVLKGPHYTPADIEQFFT